MTPKIKLVDSRINGANATNNLIKGVKIWRDTPMFAAVLAQEVREWNFKASSTILLSIPTLAAAIGLTLYLKAVEMLPVALLSVFIPVLITRLPMFRRELELRGQATTVEVASRLYGVDARDEQVLRANNLHNKYEQFKNWSVVRILGELINQEDGARDWCNKHRKQIQQWFEQVRNTNG